MHVATAHIYGRCRSFNLLLCSCSKPCRTLAWTNVEVQLVACTLCHFRACSAINFSLWEWQCSEAVC